MDNNLKIKLNKTLIFTHNTGGDGHYDDELFKYLLENKVNDITKIDFPFGKNSVKSIRYKHFKNGIESNRFESIFKFSNPLTVSFLKDFLMAIYYGIRFGFNTDIFFGMDNLLSFAGIILKKLGIVKNVYYISIDYMPIRYSNRFLNLLYYFLDKLVLYNSDMVFSLNEETIQRRIIDQKLDASKIKYFITPFGNNSSFRKKSDFDKYNLNRIVYFGGVIKDKGSELFPYIVKSLLSKGMDQVKFLVIGGGDIDLLRSKITELKLENYFEIKGRMDSHEEIEELLLTSSIALAPYFPEDSNSISYNADPGKVKVYLGCGLPVVITEVPPISRIISRQKAGLIVKYNSEDIAKSIIKIRADIGSFRKNAINLGTFYDWRNVFDRYFK